jgi:hypothetical protein
MSRKHEIQTPAFVRQASVEATVLRCGCGAPDQHPAQPCPQGRREVLGQLAFYHRNPFLRALNRVRQWWHRHRPFGG